MIPLINSDLKCIMKLRIRRKAGVALMCVGGCGQEAAQRAEIRGDGEGLRQGPGSRRGCPVGTDGARPVGAPAGEPGRNAVALGNGARSRRVPGRRGPAAFALCAEGSDAAAKPRLLRAVGLPIPAIASTRARGRATCVGLRCA